MPSGQAWLLLETMALYSKITLPSGVQGENAAEQDFPLGFFRCPSGQQLGTTKKSTVRVVFLQGSLVETLLPCKPGSCTAGGLCQPLPAFCSASWRHLKPHGHAAAIGTCSLPLVPMPCWLSTAHTVAQGLWSVGACSLTRMALLWLGKEPQEAHGAGTQWLLCPEEAQGRNPLWCRQLESAPIKPVTPAPLSSQPPCWAGGDTGRPPGR